MWRQWLLTTVGLMCLMLSLTAFLAYAQALRHGLPVTTPILVSGAAFPWLLLLGLIAVVASALEEEAARGRQRR